MTKVLIMIRKDYKTIFKKNLYNLFQKMKKIIVKININKKKS
jgi:hypothetical protein